MARIKYLTSASVQVATSPADITTYGGADLVGKTADVPDDIATMLVLLGAAERVKAPARKKAGR